MFLLILEKRDAAFPSLWTVFVLEQFGDVNFVTVLRDAGGSGERRSGCWELGGGGHMEPLSEAARGQEGRRQTGRLSPGVGKPEPREGFGQGPQVWRCLWAGVGVRNDVQGSHGPNLG